MASRSCPSKAVLSGRSITPRGGLCVSHNGNNAAEPVIAVTDLSFPTAAAAAAASCSESGAQRLKENVLEKGISFFSFFFFACTDEMRPSYQAPMLDQMIKFMISRDNRMLGAGKFKQNTKFLFSLASPTAPRSASYSDVGRLARCVWLAWELEATWIPREACGLRRW